MSDLLQLKKTINSFGKVSLLSFRDSLASLLKTDDEEFVSYIINKLQMSKNTKLKKEIVHAIEANPKVVYIPILLTLLEQETDTALVNVICKALMATESKEAIEGMKEIAKKRTTAGAIKAIENHIKKTSTKEPVEYYIKNIFKGSKDAKASLHAVNVLLRIGSEKIIPQLIENLEKTNDYMAINNALSVINGFSVTEENAFVLINFLHKNIENYHRINKLTEVINKLFEEDKDKILSTAVNGLAQTGGEDVKALKNVIDSGQKQKALETAKQIVSKKPEFFTLELVNYIILLLENRVTEAKQKLEQFEKKVIINKKLQSAIVYNNFTAVAKLPFQKLIALKDKYVEKVVEMLAVSDIQAASGAAFLAGACFEEQDDNILQLAEKSKVAEARLEFVKQLGVREDDIFYNVFLEFALNDKSLDVREQAILSLSKLPSIKSKIDELISSGEVEKEIIGIKIIKERKLDEYAEKLTKMIGEKSDLVVSEIFETFKIIDATNFYNNVKQYIEDGKSNPIRCKAIKLLPVLNTENSIDDLFEIALKVREEELKAAVIEALQEAMAEENLSDMGKIRALLDILKELMNSDKFIKVTIETGPMFNVTQKLYYAKLKEHFEAKLSQLRHAPKWDKKLLASLEIAVKDCNQKMFELDEIKEIGNKVKHFLLKLKNEKDNTALMQLVSELRDLLINEHHLLTEEVKNQIFEELFEKLKTLGNNWQIKRLFIETIGEVLPESKVVLLKDYLIDSTRAIRIESKKTILKTGLEPDELPAILFKKILVCDSSKFFKNKIFSYLSDISQLFTGKNCNIINFEENNLSDDIDLYIVDEKSYETLKLGDKKCFCILTYTILEKPKIEAMEKKGVILLQKPFVMQEIDKKIISFFR